MRVAIILSALFTLLPATSQPADAEDLPPVLTHNPFSRPSSKAIPGVPSDIEREGGAALIPELQATMVGTNNKLANVGGRILKPGDVIHGYLLVAIHEQFAIFRKKGDNITVYVKPLAEKDE